MIDALLFAAGLFSLLAGAELMVRGAAPLALSLGLSPLVVGLTVVAFCTSAPEIAVSARAVLEGHNDITVGNVIGSNVFNLRVILGFSAVVAPLVVRSQVIRQEVPIMLGSAVLLMLISRDGVLGHLDAALLSALLLAYIVFLVLQARRGPQPVGAEYASEFSRRANQSSPLALQLGLIIAGLALLVVGASWLVDAASAFARALGMSDLVIGLTIVAAGTSLPELATSAVATLRGERDIAIGNAIGSCTFNTLGCLGVSGLLSASGLTIAPSALNFDLWVMLAAGFACVPVMLTGRRIARWEGALFLGYYASYTAYLILATQEHDALPVFSQAMLWFVIPLTVLTLAGLMLRARILQ
ncbi:MAG: calcium/sodium antiporter [Quisquiliibacterium sp.]